MTQRMMTALGLKNLKPREQRYSVSVGGARGLRCEVLPSGHKSFHVAFRMKGNPRLRKLTLDQPISALAEARAATATAWVDIERGVDVAAKKQEAKKAARTTAVNVADDGPEKHAARFLELPARRATGAANAKQAELALYRHALPAWRGLKVQDIRRAHIIPIIEHIAYDQGHPYMANRVLGHLSKFFSWLVARDVIGSSP